jgi:hypothetical protein
VAVRCGVAQSASPKAFRLTSRHTDVPGVREIPKARSLGDKDQLKQIKFTPMSTKLLELDRRYFDDKSKVALANS